MLHYISLNKKHKRFGKIILSIFVAACFACGLFCFLHTGRADASSYPESFCFRDDYYINTQDQGAFGNCWTFANIKDMEIILAQKTGEHFELNENYVAITRKVNVASERQPEELVYGAGGSVNDFISAINNNGFVLDSDLTYENFYFINDDTQPYIFDSLNRKADKTTLTININNTNSYYVNYDYEVIKYYITQYGNCTININAWKLIDNNGRSEIVAGSSGGHSLFVLGWDDNYIANNNTRGAYIILNSYGMYDSYWNYQDDGIIYLPYHNTLGRTSISAFAYEVNLPQDYVYLSSNAAFTANLKDKYYYSSYLQGKTSTLKEKNLFDVDDDYRLDYKFPELENLQYDLTIFRGESNVNNLFYILPDDYNCYINKKTDVPSGEYKIKIDYSYTQGGKKIEKTILKQLFILDGLDYNTVFVPDEEDLVYNFVSTDGIANSNNTIYVTQSALNRVGQTEVRITLTPYTNYNSYQLLQGGKVVSSGNKLTTGNYILPLKISQNYLNSNENEFILRLSSEKTSKDYKIIINHDSGTFTGSGGVNEKFTAFVYFDLDGGEIEQSYPTRMLFSTNGSSYFSKQFLDVLPQKEGFVFDKFVYLASDGTWQNLSSVHNAQSQYAEKEYRYYLTSSNILRAKANNYYTYTDANFNFKNYCFVKAIYRQQDNKILLTAGSEDKTLFEFDDEIKASFDLTTAQSISWTLDNQEAGTGLSINLGKVSSGKHILSVKYQQNGKIYTKNITFAVKYHFYQVEIDKTVFTYNNTLQHPQIEIDGLMEGEDYTLVYPNSIQAGEYKLQIKSNENNIGLSVEEVPYVINKVVLDLQFESQMINQGQSPDTNIKFTYSSENWFESAKPTINFDFYDVENWKWQEGEHKIGFKIANITQSYDISQVEPPVVVVVRSDFDASQIELTTKDTGDNESKVFQYGQTFLLKFDCVLAMIKNITYTVKDSQNHIVTTFKSKQQYISQKLPVGKYTIEGEGTLVNGDTIQDKIEVDIQKLNIKIILKDNHSPQGIVNKLDYTIESDVQILDLKNFVESDLQIAPYIENFDSGHVGQYAIKAKVDGNTENYNIEIVEGKYTIDDNSDRVYISLIVALLVVMILLGILIILRARIKHKRKNMR